MTSYGRNKNHDDEIKKTKRRPIIAPAIAVRLLMKRKTTMGLKNLFMVNKLNVQTKEFENYDKNRENRTSMCTIL